MNSRKLILSLALVVGACSKGTSAPPSRPVTDPIPMAEPAASTGSPASSVSEVLVAYERVRALLATDELTGVGDAARAIEAAAKAASAGSPSNTHLSSIATSAATLAIATDLKAARASFGEVSRHVIALVASDKALANGHHVFECPMVTGYNKWVQPSGDLQNPYMGKRMLTCGGESTWQ